MDEPTYMFIAGTARSGSTLIERLVVERYPVLAVGEVYELFRPSGRCATWAPPVREKCSCGEPLPDCPFWGVVIPEAFGGFARKNLYPVHSLFMAVLRRRNLPRILTMRRTGSSSPAWSRKWTELHDIWLRFISVARAEAGSLALLDSSKSIPYLLLLDDITQVSVLHLLRDPRGVAFSEGKVGIRTPLNESVMFPPRRPAASALQWTETHVLLDLLRSSLRLRYEDVARDPERVMAWLPDFGERQEGSAHSVRGNPAKALPMREVVLDEEWRQSMSKVSQATVVSLTWPVMRRHGYRVGSRAKT